MPILYVDNLHKTFTSGLWPFTKQTSYTAVNGISFQLNTGEIFGLLGPNGAGKTTTIQMLIGTLTPTHGTISYFGQNFAQHRIHALKKIGYASGYDKLPHRLTVLENLDIIVLLILSQVLLMKAQDQQIFLMTISFLLTQVMKYQS